MSKLLSVDAETDGLYGDVWAIGALVFDRSKEPAKHWDAFSGMIEPTEEAVTDPWVREHIVPVVDLPRYDSRTELLNAFWGFWMEHKEDALCIADCGTPVESGLFRACVEMDLKNRMWEGPAPLHELATLFLLKGYDPWNTNRREFAGRDDLVLHDPLDDAIAAALCWQKLVSQ